jgi:hypothetical protein
MSACFDNRTYQMDLLTLCDLEPPMGDFAIGATLASTRAVWATPIDGEDDAPSRRIIHTRTLQLHGPARLDRLGLRRTPGYHKCGSRMDLDWVAAFRVLVWEEEEWRVLRYEADEKPPEAGDIRWYDLGGVRTSALILEVRRSGIDRWWSGWNLASGAFVLEGETAGGPAPRCERRLAAEVEHLTGLPSGLTARHGEGEVRYRTRFFEVGFWLERPGFSYLAIDGSGRGRTRKSLVRSQPGSCFQGPMLLPVGHAPVAATTLRSDVRGFARVEANRVTYDIALGRTGQHYTLGWQVLEDRIVLQATRQADRQLRAWKSSAWQIGLDVRAAAAHVVGAITRQGETGILALPLWWHAPGMGSLRIHAEGGDVLFRSDADRPADLATGEFKLGEQPQPEGDYLLPAGHYTAEVTIAVAEPKITLRPEAPAVVSRAVRRCALTALTYRPDTATLSNNGISIHCPISMDNWSAVTLRLGHVLPNLEAADLLRDSLERWLDGGPGYTSGILLQDGDFHEAEDEYIMTAAAGLLGLAEYLNRHGTSDWLARYRGPIGKRLLRTRSYDIDDDGLIESVYRTGTSGSGQWSTSWLDVVSFGWKDAFSNALLYPALIQLAAVLPRLGAPDLASGLDDWAMRLRAAYHPTFHNPETGWIAGWRCRDGRLHDHAFPFVSGAAVCGGVLEPDVAREVIDNLWREMERQRLPDARYGLPVSLWHIPDEDLADIMQGYPKGYYQNAGVTMAQARHFVGALYRVGMADEADRLVEQMCEGLAEGVVIGGSKSGLDWRAWDGSPCGYEGLLTDQLGILGVILERFCISASSSTTSAVHQVS